MLSFLSNPNSVSSLSNLLRKCIGGLNAEISSPNLLTGFHRQVCLDSEYCAVSVPRGYQSALQADCEQSEAINLFQGFKLSTICLHALVNRSTWLEN